MNSELPLSKKRKTAADRHPLAIAFGLYLKNVRKAQDKSQIELAFDASVDRTYISLLERGLSAPSLLVLNVLAKSLNCTMTDLISGFESQWVKQDRRKTRSIKRRVNESTLELHERPQGSRRSPLR